MTFTETELGHILFYARRRQLLFDVVQPRECARVVFFLYTCASTVVQHACKTLALMSMRSSARKKKTEKKALSHLLILQIILFALKQL